MKWSLFTAAALVTFCSVAQRENVASDTSAISLLLRQSQASQWIDPTQSLAYADQALIQSQMLNYPTGVAKAKNLKGFAFWTFGDNDLAIQAALEALQLADAVNSTIQSESYYVLARGYMDVSEQEKAWDALQKAEKLALAGQNWGLQTSIYNLMGVIQFVKDKQDSALHFYFKALELGKAHAVHPINFPRIVSNIGECYLSENPTLAFSNFFNAMEMAKATGNQVAKASIGAIIGNAYVRRNDLKKAESYLNESLALAQSLGLRRVVRHAYAGFVDMKLRQGKKDEAMVYQRKYYEVRDSLLNTAKVRQIVELEAKHALEMKEQDIRILENEKRLQSMWNNVLAGAVVLLIAVAIGGYQWLQYRHRKNREVLNLEIDYLTQQQQASLLDAPGEGTIESMDQKLLRNTISTVEKNLGNPSFGVEEMASEMSMSRTSLHRKIKSITGFPPSELIRSIRLRKAAKLIANRADTVTQIALQVGFDDYSHFSKSFKKHFGVSPTLYEEQAKS